MIDADGHVLEAAGLWEKYCEAKYKPLAVRLGKDDRGLQYLEVNGKPSKFIRRGVLGILGAMGMLSRDNWQWDFHRQWGEVAALGAVDAKERDQAPGCGKAGRRDHLPDHRTGLGKRMRGRRSWPRR